MKYSINGSTVALNKDIITEESLNTMIKEIDSSYESCSKAIEAYNLVSNVKAMESFGYKATEGLGESIANGAKAVWEKIKEFFKRISLFVNKMITDFIMKMSFPKTKIGLKADTTKTVLSNASKYIYDASIKIIKKISSSDIYNNNDELKRYQKLEITAHSLIKIIREDARTLASIMKSKFTEDEMNVISSGLSKPKQENVIQFEHGVVEKFLDDLSDCIVHTEQMCKLFHDECENPQFDIPKIDKLYKLTEYWLNQVKSSFEEFKENIKNISEQKKTVDIDKYIEDDGFVLTNHIAWDVRFGRLSHQDIIEILKDERIKKAFIGTHLEQKRPQSEWSKEYLVELLGMASMTCFNEDYLLFLEKVAKYVNNHKIRSFFNKYKYK